MVSAERSAGKVEGQWRHRVCGGVQWLQLKGQGGKVEEGWRHRSGMGGKWFQLKGQGRQGGGLMVE